LIQQCPTPGEPKSWWVKLTDFGISKRQGADTRGASTVIGTQEYMAPELLGHRSPESPSEIDCYAADMWALGILTLRVLTKTYVFANTFATLRYLQSPGTLFPRNTLDKHGVSTDGQDFIRALLRPQPEKRLDSKAAFLHEWARFCVNRTRNRRIHRQRV